MYIVLLIEMRFFLNIKIKNNLFTYIKRIMSKYESRNYAYLLEDVMKNNLTHAWNQEELWKIAKNKKVIKYKMNDVKHWVINNVGVKKILYFNISSTPTTSQIS